MRKEELRNFLDEQVERFNRPDFIPDDPISIPHRFTLKQDIEISGFLAAAIAWGKRGMIIRNANRLMEWMDHSPYEFIKNHSASERKVFLKFNHRTFMGSDCEYFIRSLQRIYSKHESMEELFLHEEIKQGIINFRKEFFKLKHLPRTEKHIADPGRGSHAKRLNMFLRWMVRRDNKGVDFGIWKKISPSKLMMPLDIHTGSVGRQLNLLTRKQDDWKAVEELTASLREFDKNDPVKYDFALFGIGVTRNK
jgi:uncharacterized protein (TIGR02757 family)